MLEIQNLCKTYPGSVDALSDVTLSIEPGIFGLLGPNGAGKSTLMRILATLQLPDSGGVSLGDVDVIANPRDARRLIGYLPQDVGAYPRVTAREMLEYVAGLKELGSRSSRKQLVDDQLAKVNLSPHADKRLDTFSGGMRQRFGIAAALIGNPKLVIVDEPTAGLDPLERRRFQLMLTEAAKDCVLILSSHIVEDIAGLCNEMALINNGRIVAQGIPDSLTKSLDGKVWEFRTSLEEFAAIDHEHQVLSWQPNAGSVTVRVWSEDQNKIDDSAVPVKASLEDLYVFHVG